MTTDQQSYEEQQAILRQELTAKYGQCWDTTQLQEEFEVLGFYAYMCVVRRKSDGMKGSLDFTHSPRLYYSFVAAPNS